MLPVLAIGYRLKCLAMLFTFTANLHSKFVTENPDTHGFLKLYSLFG